MIVLLQMGGYATLLWLLAFGGNAACRLVLKSSATRTPPEAGESVSLRAGRTIGVLERCLVFLSLVAGSWEMLAAVIALKTVARYAKLDEQSNAEYFLVGSLASLLWAVTMTFVIALYDRSWGFGFVAELSGALGASPP
jgi:hypothetical protein